MSPRKTFGVAAFHLLVLWAFACVQPLLDILARHAEFFVVRGSEPVDLLLLVLMLAVALPIPLIGIEALAALLGRRVWERTHLLLVALLCAVILLAPFSRVFRFDGWGIVAAALLLGSGAAAAYSRFPMVRTLVTLAGVGIVAFPVLFLFNASVRKVVYPRDRVAIRGADVQDETPVVVVVFDAFPLSALLAPDRRIDAQMFPNFADLAEHSIWFRNATAVSENTIRAIPAILTGRFPQRGLHPTVTDHPGNLFTLLQDAYEIHSIETLTRLGPTHARPVEPLTVRLRTLFSDLRVIYVHVLLPDDLTTRLPPISQSWGNFAVASDESATQRKRTPASQRAQEFVDFVETMERGDSRSLWFAHVVLPHSPHVHYPSGRRYTNDPVLANGQGNQWGKWTADEWAADQGYQRFLLQVSLVDNLVGELIERLRATDLWDDAILVVTADHGASYRAGDQHRGLTETNFAEIMSVPLFVRAPGLAGGTISNANVESIDVLPTVADLLDIEPTWVVDGLSAFDPAIADRTEKVCDRTNPVRFAADAMEARYETVAHKTSLFGATGNDRWYRLGPHGDLVGRPVDSFDVAAEPSIAVRLDRPEPFVNVTFDRGIVPGEIVGTVRRDPGASLPWIAVAVNGIVQAVTRPFADDQERDAALWAALVPEDAFRSGRNEIAIYSVDALPGGQVGLRAVSSFEGRPQLIGVTLGGKQVWGVRDAGFHPQSWSGDTPMRWTNGNGRLIVPIAPESPPRELLLQLVTGGSELPEVEVKVNGTSIFVGVPPRPQWSTTLSLAGIVLGEQATIEILSDTFVPAKTVPGSMDSRTLGVGVVGVTLR